MTVLLGEEARKRIAQWRDELLADKKPTNELSRERAERWLHERYDGENPNEMSW